VQYSLVVPHSVELRFPPGDRTPFAFADTELVPAAATALELGPERIARVDVTRISFDARRRHRVWRVGTTVWLTDEALPQPPVWEPVPIEPPPAGAPRVVIIGSGPAGLFAALELLATGVAVTVVERGGDVRSRRRPIAELNRGGDVDPETNYCFGEGGAGTFSDGKLYTRAGRKPAVRKILETLVRHGAPPAVLTSWRPHIGSNRLPEVVQSLRSSIVAGGGVVRFLTRADSLVTERDVVTGVVVTTADGTRETLAAEAVVLATGHSSRAALAMARTAGAKLEAKGFAMGVRVEHPQAWIDQHQYGGLRATCDLPAASYELVTKVSGRGVYSFCMCPGGLIVPTTTQPDRVVVNGMSLSRRDSPFANSGIVVAIEPADWCGETGVSWGFPDVLAAAGLDDRLPASPCEDPLFGVRLQEALETLAGRAGGGHNRAPSQRVDLFVRAAAEAGAPLPTSYLPGLRPCDLGALLPRGIAERLRAAFVEFNRRIPGFGGPSGQLLAVESRTSSPVRVARDPESLQSLTVERLYPCGEGAGYAGGIMSAAIDGTRVAAAVTQVVRSS